MSFPIGVFTFDPQPPAPPKPKKPKPPKTPSTGSGKAEPPKGSKQGSPEAQLDSPRITTPQVGSPRLGLLSWRKNKSTTTLRKPLGSKTFSAKSRTSAESNPLVRNSSSSGDELHDIRQALELSPPESVVRTNPLPKHVPIVIPEYNAPDSPSLPKTYSSPILKTVHENSPVHSSPKPSSSQERPEAAPARPKHVAIKLPDWAQPINKQPLAPPQIDLRQSTFLDPFADIYKTACRPLSRRGTNLSRFSFGSRATASTSDSKMAHQGSDAVLSSAHSSQTSLLGRRDEYESASEAESVQEDAGDTRLPPTQAERAKAANSSAQYTSSSVSNLAGLVCNIQRTMGKEPPALVGATTTILGDKLYVFGGRKSSHSKPRLSSKLYELDLIKRFWTKLEVKGDVPAPRYFHSVCALGDSKLVCYGGMVTTAGNADGGPEPKSEVQVKSDIYIFDVPSKTWMKISCQEAPQGRYAHCATILPSSAVFASANAPMSAVHHNPSSSNANQGTLGVALDGTGGAEMVVVGGQDGANNYIEEISVFNLRSLKWTGTTPMARQCGAYRSVVAPLTSMTENQIGAGPIRHDYDDDDDDEETLPIGSGAPMIIYSNYNFLDVRLELQIRCVDGSVIEKQMQSNPSPPGLRFPNGGVIANHFIVSGTFLSSSKHEYAVWALDLRTLVWTRIDVGGSMFSHGSWNRGVLWSRRNAFVILGNRRRSLVDDYNNRRVNFTNVCLVELEAFGLYDNPRRMEPSSDYRSLSANLLQENLDVMTAGRRLVPSAEAFGAISMNITELADMEFLSTDGIRIPVNSRLVARRWGLHFTNCMRESLSSTSETDTATLRPTNAGHPSRISSITITPSVSSAATTVVSQANAELPDARSIPPQLRPRVFYLPHKAATLQALVHYLYTSTLPAPPSPLATPQVFCSLLQLARPYKIDGLLEAVVESLHESLDDRNAAAIFNAAAMAAGGGEGVQFASAVETVRESTIPIRNANITAGDGSLSNGGRHAVAGHLRINTDTANNRRDRNTLRPGGPASMPEESEDEPPSSAGTDSSMSDMETSLASSTARAAWQGDLCGVVGLQKRGLRGLMEGRRMRQRGASDTDGRVGLGIA